MFEKLDLDKAKLVADLQNRLKPSRFIHTLGVAGTAKQLARIYNADEEKAEIAGLFHDYAKHEDDEKMLDLMKRRNIISEACLQRPNLMHGYLAAEMMQKRYGITDKDIISAVECHTFGKVGMNLYDKIIYLADIAEPGRDFDGIEEIRHLMQNNINEAVLKSMECSIKFIVSERKQLAIETVMAYNDILIQIKKGK